MRRFPSFSFSLFHRRSRRGSIGDRSGTDRETNERDSRFSARVHSFPTGEEIPARCRPCPLTHVLSTTFFRRTVSLRRDVILKMLLDRTCASRSRNEAASLSRHRSLVKHGFVRVSETFRCMDPFASFWRPGRPLRERARSAGRDFVIHGAISRTVKMKNEM